jgi:hypothetical protein
MYKAVASTWEIDEKIIEINGLLTTLKGKR